MVIAFLLNLCQKSINNKSKSKVKLGSRLQCLQELLNITTTLYLSRCIVLRNTGFIKQMARQKSSSYVYGDDVAWFLVLSSRRFVRIHFLDKHFISCSIYLIIGLRSIFAQNQGGGVREPLILHQQ